MRDHTSVCKKRALIWNYSEFGGERKRNMLI
jgi:hypothetical protein